MKWIVVRDVKQTDIDTLIKELQVAKAAGATSVGVNGTLLTIPGNSVVVSTEPQW